MAEADTTALRHSPLDAEHRALGARMAPFGGWEMPIQYTSVLEEHRACREHAVAFDVSHLGSVHVAGSGAFDMLQWAFTNDLTRIEPGRAQYTHLLVKYGLEPPSQLSEQLGEGAPLRFDVDGSVAAGRPASERGGREAESA